MKKILLLLVVLVSSVTFAQNNGITYQAVIYSTSGESVPGIRNSNSPLSNKAICLQFSIVDASFSTEYQEKVTVTTDDYGMVNLVIGNGTQTGGYANSFNAIVWSNPNKYLKVSVDQTGNCSSFELFSDQILTYVPFALAANSATSVSGIVGIANGGTNATTVLGAKTNLQLQNVDNTRDLDKPIATLTQLALDNKVEKVAGKKLSTEDFTTDEKTKLASIGGTQDLSSLAPLLSPNFTGIPIAPTASSGTNSTQIATTAFVNSTVASVASSTNGNFVNVTSNQTVSGNKTFNNNLTINSILVGKGSGIQSTLFGNAANATKDNTTAIGFMSLNGNSGISNTSVGTNAMRNSGLTSMSTAIGEGSGTGVTTGNGNTFLGHSANVTNNSAIENATSVGYQALVTSSNTIQLGNSNVTDVKTNGSYTGTGFKTPTGTSSQYLMADGSVMSSTLSNYLPISGGSMTGQLAIGTSSPQTSAILDITSTTQGFLPPRMTQSQRNAINNPIAGLVVWCNNCGLNGELQVYNGTTWTNMIGGNASVIPIRIGDSYGGGTVIYLFQSGDLGYIADQYHGIIVANEDAGYSPWGCNGITTNAVGSNVGTASQNTSNIISSNCGSTAAQFCVDYRGGGYSDWSLPSINELNIVFSNRLYLPSSLSQYLYWSSTETSSAGAYRKDMRYTNTGGVQSFGKTSNSHVRAVRYF